MTKARRNVAGRLLLTVLLVTAAVSLGWWLLPRETGTSAPAREATGATDAPIDNAADSGAPGSRRKRGVAVAEHSAALSAPLPPPGTPLAQTYAELKARADAGDAAAASRLYREARSCFRARIGAFTLPKAVRSFLNQNPQSLNEHQVRLREEYLAGLEREMQQSKETAAGCAGLSDAQLQLVPLTFRAAQLGDAEASACYVSGTFLFAGGGLLDHPEWLAQYKNNALQLAQSGIEQGNWLMVAQLRAAYGGEQTFTLGQLIGPDPVKNYRFLKLQWLASPGNLRAQLNEDLADATSDLSAGQLADADAWAQDAFVRYFGAQQKDDLEDTVACHD